MPQHTAVGPAVRALLKHLAARGAWLDSSAAAAAGIPTYRLMRAQAGMRHVEFPGEIVEQATRHGWLRQDQGRITLAPAGVRTLRRTLAGADGPHGKQPFETPAPGSATARPVRPGMRPPTERAPGLNELESPLGWLRRRKDKDGQPMLSEEQFAAGERLRADVYFAGLTPRVTASWSPTAGIADGRRSAPGGSAQMVDGMVAARQRVSRALDAVGPELSGVLLDVCSFLKGLEAVEQERGWPSRSGKVVLQLALTRLAHHYGLLRHAKHGGGRIRHWDAGSARPDHADREITEGEADDGGTGTTGRTPPRRTH